MTEKPYTETDVVEWLGRCVRVFGVQPESPDAQRLARQLSVLLDRGLLDVAEQLGAAVEATQRGGNGRPTPHLDAVRALAARLADALADCVVKATPYGTQDGNFIANYISPTGPIHRAIPLLQELDITVRPGFDGRDAACPCLPGAPEHRHGVGGYAPDVPADNPVPVPADPEAASRVIAAAEALEQRLWTRGLTEDDMTPEHRELAQALASYNSFVRTAAGGGIAHSPVDADHPPAGLRCRHSELCVDARPQHHVIAFAGDGTWSLEHPATCRAENDAADAADWDCPVRQLAERQIPSDLAALMAGGRYTCHAGDVGDLFQLGDRLHDDQCTTPVCAACGCWCHAEEQTEG